MIAATLSARPAGWWAAAVAVIGTLTIGAGAFWLSFTALADLARLAGIATGQAWAWAVIVDGVIVVSTVAVVALHPAGRRAVAYPWLLLAAAAGVSVVANVLHAIVAASTGVPQAVAGAIAAVPPLVLLAMTHLTVVVARHARRPASAPGAATPDPGAGVVLHERKVAASPPVEPRELARQLRSEGQSSRQIAAGLGVHRSTVDRWVAQTTPGPHETENQNESDEETT